MSEDQYLGEHISREGLGDDAYFDRVGDLLTADELRGLDLHEPENLLTSIEYLADHGEVGSEGV